MDHLVGDIHEDRSGNFSSIRAIEGADALIAKAKLVSRATPTAPAVWDLVAEQGEPRGWIPLARYNAESTFTQRAPAAP